MNKNEVRGKIRGLRGRMMQIAGLVTGNRRLQEEGAVERAEGAIQAGVGRAHWKGGRTFKGFGKSTRRLPH
jgi:uncharacterized protein YjbJ (UPF0337 family)